MEHWREAVDQATNRVYYYNRKTRETSWVAPLGYASSGLANAQEQRRLHRRGHFSVVTAKGIDGIAGQIPLEGESETANESENEDRIEQEDEREIKSAIDSATGRVYYYDRKTRETFWEDPRKENSDSLVEKLLRRVQTNLRVSKNLSRGGSAVKVERSSIASAEGDNGNLETILHSEDDTHFEHAVFSEEDDVESKAEESSPSINDVRASLKLLKTRIKSRSSSLHTENLESENPHPIPTRPPPAVPERESQRIAGKQLRGPGLEKCERRSGCTCAACIDQAPVEVALVECHICSRSFHPDSLTKHLKGCSLKRASQSKKRDSGSTPSARSKPTHWREKSEQLRAAVKRSNGGEGYKETLVECPHCHRSFNEKAAERHIPICTKIKAKPKMLRRRSGMGAHSSNKNKRHARPQQNPAPRAKPPIKRVSVSESGVNLSPCPHCSRCFSAKAFERHLDFCRTLKEKNSLERKITEKTPSRKEFAELTEQTTSYGSGSGLIGMDDRGQYYYKFQFDE